MGGVVQIPILLVKIVGEESMYILQENLMYQQSIYRVAIFSQMIGRRWKDEKENIDPHCPQGVVRYDCGWREDGRVQRNKNVLAEKIILSNKRQTQKAL